MTRRMPSEYSWDPADLLFDETLLPMRPVRFTHPRQEKVQFIVIHHMTIVGRGDGGALTACFNTWKERVASAHYGVDGQLVRQFVRKGDAAYATADHHGNHAGISVEHANSTAGPKWLVADDTLATSARLVAALHVFEDLGRPVSGKTLRQHDEFYATACPGPYLGGTHWAAYVKTVQDEYDRITHQEEDDDMPLSDADIEKIAKRTAQLVWDADVIPVERPTDTADGIKKNPTWTAKGALGKLLKRQAIADGRK